MGKLIDINKANEHAGDFLPGGLILTKLNRPPCVKDYIPRQRLTSQLDRDVECLLALICAPAGFGKTTLAASWLANLQRPNCWVTLDEKDDLHSFLQYFVEAVRKIFPESLPKMLKLLGESRLPNETKLVSTLLNELEGIDTPFVIALDDSHKVRDSRVWQALNQLLRFPPSRLHLLIISRENPPLSLSNLRALGQLTELRVEKLRFNQAETKKILFSIADYTISDYALAKLEEQNVGWPVGLRLLGLAMREEVDKETFLAHAWEYPMLREYFSVEVFSKQPDFIKHALLATSVVDRFTPSLCRSLSYKLAGESGSASDPVGALIQSGLFVIPLDETGRWFRYHQVFQNLLQDELKRIYSEDTISGLHLVASEWLADEGLVEEAMRHAIEAGQPRNAADIFIDARDHIMNREDRVRFSRCLDRLPRNLIEQDPRLLVSSAWELLFYGDYQEMMSLLERAEALLLTPSWADSRDRIEPEIANLRSRQAYVDRDVDAAMLFAQRAISDLSWHADWLRGYAATAIGVAFNMSGNAAKGIDELDRLRRQYRTAGGVFHTHLETGITLIYLMQGNYSAMLESAELLIALGKKCDLRFARLSGCYFAGWALYAQNELIKARAILSDALQDSGAAHSPYFAHSAFLLASCYVALGDEKNAQRVVAELQQVSIDYNQPSWTNDLRAFKVELAIRLGRKEAAIAGSDWVAAGSRYRSHLYYHPLLTRIKTLLFLGEAEGLKEGKTQLDEFRLMLSRMNDKRAVAEAQALVALIQDALGNRAAALETLKGALIESGASLRTFLDLGEPMAQLLPALPQNSPCGEMIEKMSKAFAAASTSAGLKTADSSIQLENFLQSPDPLSKRELEVLRLLGHRLRDKEIARKLNISPGTVKSHLKSVYRKLGVAGRLEAAAKVGALDSNRASPPQRGSMP